MFSATLCKHLTLLIGEKVLPHNITAIGGGSINQTYKLEVEEKGRLFCKINSASKFPQLFEKEAAGLRLLQQKGFKKVAEVVAVTQVDDSQVLLLKWVESGKETASFWEKFGEQLAQLHQNTNSVFGLDEDNYMGSIAQNNTAQKNWHFFFAYQRLQPLVELCYTKDLLSQKEIKGFEKVYSALPHIFEDEPPSLLHGDLWSGNFMCNSHASPVLIDPAVYYGHRSMDLAMTKLFGGFDKSFYRSYQYHFPLPQNYLEQFTVCNLYPLLIHLALFGKSYLPPIKETLLHYQ